jgi:outer membrane cobalamin receptor
LPKLDLGYTLFKSTQLSGIVDYNRTTGYRKSGFGNHNSEIGSAALLIKQDYFYPTGKMNWVSEKNSQTIINRQCLFSIGSSYPVESAVYKLKLNLSRNFRIPTFNDLYWEEGGNRDLKPESSYQAEIRKRVYI